MTAVASPQQARLTGVGASEVAAALGLDPYRGPLELFLEKTGQVDRPDPNQHQLWGHVIEPLLLERYGIQEAPEAVPYSPDDLEARFGERCRPALKERERTIVHPEHEWLFSTPDLVLRMDHAGGHRGVEAKNRGPYFAQFWGDSGTDQIPFDVALQCHTGMLCLQCDEWGIAAYFGGSDFRTFLVRRDEEIARAILEGVGAFWFDHVVSRKPPKVNDGNERTHTTLARLFAKHGEIILEADAEQNALIADFLDKRELADQFTAVRDTAQAQLKQMIGENAGIQGPAGKLTWKKTRDGEVIDWEATARDVADRFCPDAEFRHIIASHTTPKLGYRQFRVASGGAK